MPSVEGWIGFDRIGWEWRLIRPGDSFPPPSGMTLAMKGTLYEVAYFGHAMAFKRESIDYQVSTLQIMFC